MWKPYVVPMAVWERRGSVEYLAPDLTVGVYRDLLNPLMGPLGVVGEGYVDYPGGQMDGGLRLLAASRFFFLQLGWDYSFRFHNTDFLLGLTLPLRRGGPLGRGGHLRIDWLPGRDHSFHLGLHIPVWQPHMGHTRPRKDHVSLPKASAPDRSTLEASPVLGESLAHLRQAAEWITLFTTPFLDRSTSKSESDLAEFTERLKEWKTHIHLKDALYPDGHTFVAEVNRYHEQLTRSYALAIRETDAKAESDLSESLAAKTRSLLLDQVILPYNRLLGQLKKHDSVLGYGHKAASMFEQWLADSSAVSVSDRAAVVYVFRSLIQYIEDSRKYSKSLWKDSRLVWIPLHYALRFEDLDTEDELDSLIERAVGHEFTEANDVDYVLNELFLPELERTIKNAEDYHVLWVHDFTGPNAAGAPDSISYRLTVETYLRTLINRVKSFDQTGRLPVYMIFLDEHYYLKNKSRIWLDLLANPLDHNLKLPPENRPWSETVHAYQEELRQAVAQSSALQAKRKLHGNGWLKNRIKVHINITNPSDMSFRSRTLIDGFAFVPDNLMRDHRKIAFYDVTELDPRRGEALYTGMGVGEHYLGSTWEDRSVLVRGPALVSLKGEARALLRSQGFDEGEIPEPLQPLPRPARYDSLVDECRLNGWTASAMEVQNQTGYGPKPVTLIKAILYDAMPNGSHLYIPDALWISPYWGSMLLGASLRGCAVLVISPSVENAPSSGAPQMSLANELFTRFLIIQNEMKAEIESAGGMFRAGIYNVEHEVGDLGAWIQQLHTALADDEQLRAVFPFDTSVVERVGRLSAQLAALGFHPNYYAGDHLDRKPKLHLKSQFLASAPTIETVVPLKGWGPIIEKYLTARMGQVAHDSALVSARALRELLAPDVASLYMEWLGIVPASERSKAILYLTVGSHNQDYRSMVMDGEALFVVGRQWSLIGYLDFVALAGETTWLESQEQLEGLLPAKTGFWRWLGRFLKLGL